MKTATSKFLFSMEQKYTKTLNLLLRKSRYFLMAAIIGLAVWTESAQAQTIKPFQVRVEVAPNFSGTVILTNNSMRVGTNGASALDGTGTNWSISTVNVSISGAPSGVTATLVDSSTNLVSSIPIVISTNSASKTTNLFVKLDFDGTQSSGLSTLGINLIGGVTNGYFPLVLEVAKIWNGAANAAVNGAGNWSSAGQWYGGAPSTNDNVVFTDLGTQTNTFWTNASVGYLLTNSVVDTTTVISSLRFSQTNGTGTPNTNFHNLYIRDGVTLAIKGAGGFSMLKDYTYAATKMNVLIYGTNGTLIQTNEASNFSILADGQTASVLDMSGLGNLNLDVNMINFADIINYPNYQWFITNGYTPGSTFGGSRPSKCIPTWKMALTNVVKAVYVDPYNYTNSTNRTYAFELGRNETTGGSSGTYPVLMGYSNAFYMDSLCVAGYSFLGGALSFQNTNSSAVFRNTNGGRMSVLAFGDAAGSSLTGGLGNNTKCGNSGFGVDFTKGTVNVLVDRFYMSMDRGYTTGPGTCQSSLGMVAGIFDANTAFIGYQSSGNQTNQNNCTATLTVTNTAIFKVNGTLAIGYTTASIGDPSLPATTKGVINIGPGGTLMASNITVGGTTKASTGNWINLTGGASLIVSNGIADSSPNGALGTLSFGGNSSLTLFIDGSKPSAPLVYVTNLSASLTGNKLVIGKVSNLSYPADVPLIAGAGPAIAATVFDGGVVMPVGSGLSGTLSLSSSNTINIHIINRQPNYLVWRGTNASGTAAWDYTTKNWQVQGTSILTNYDNPDYVAFDDNSGVATNISISAASVLTPTQINMTNSSVLYSFVDGGNQIAGGPALNKYGTKNLNIDGNTTVNVALNQGTLTGAGSVGGVTVAAGATAIYSGTIGGSVSCAGLLTSSGSIGGSLSVLSGGVVTNAGSLAAGAFTVQTNGFLYNSGTMSLIGAGSSGSPQVAAGGTLYNAASGTIGKNNGGEILYVNGDFKDFGGSLILQSVTIGASGTFTPGGTSGTGTTTTISSDATGTYPAAALFIQGSSTTFNLDPTVPANNVLAAGHISFGGSSGNQTQNGGTLVINNVSASPFAAGQTFHLFDNTYSSGTIPYNTGTSTNTFPVISPATPGDGLSWDLSHLWVPNGSGVSGNIGVISSSSGPSITNNIARDGTGTNIVVNLAWDPSYYGYRLQNLVTPNTVGLTTTNWTSVNGSWTNLSVTITNTIGTNAVFYRLVYP
jgi:hypothetical protein